MKQSLTILLSILIITGCNNREFPEVKNVDQIKNTDFVFTLEHPINKKKNQIYCSTLGYAWNELKTELNGKIKIDKKFKQLRILNESIGFKNSMSADEILNSSSIEEGKIKIKSEFSLTLPFNFDFTRNNYDLLFLGDGVESFGSNGYDRDTGPQIEILYYENENEFAVKLLPKIKEHEIILCTSSNLKAEYLSDLIESFNKKSIKHSKVKKTYKNRWKYDFNGEDILSIPVFNYNLQKNYKELTGNIINSSTGELTIELAYQRIGLILDEKGAKVESEALTEFPTESEMDSPKPKMLIFNKPFLLIFKRNDSNNPYLVSWITNTELMVKK